jgi:hypothetical protein
MKGTITTMPEDLAAHYLTDTIDEYRKLKRLGERAMAQLKDEHFFVALDAESNSIAVIVKHLAGNMRSRWVDFLTSDGEKPDRHRDQEFVIDEHTTRAQVMQWWEQGWQYVFAALEPLTPADLLRTVMIRSEAHTVLQAINRQLTHYAQHTGQIVFLAKHLQASDWQSLSVPRGQSEQFRQMMIQRLENKTQK